MKRFCWSADLPVCESIEECEADVQDEFVADVFGVAEERDVHPVGDKLNLGPHRRCELVSVVEGPRIMHRHLFDHAVQFFAQPLMLRGL